MTQDLDTKLNKITKYIVEKIGSNFIGASFYKESFMGKIILYTNHCPRCAILEKKLQEKNIAYETFTDVQKMIDMRFESMPVLQVDGKKMLFKEAVKWVNEE